MTDKYDDLIRWLGELDKCCANINNIYRRALEAINALADTNQDLAFERDKLVSVICAHVAKRKEYFDRAEKAEADLAAARAALEQDCTGCIHAPECTGETYNEECMSCCRFYGDLFAIAAARAEKGETKAPAWPSGCRDKSSCARHEECMYMKCQHQGRDIKGEIAAARAEGGE